MLCVLPVLVHGISNLKLEDVLLDSWILSIRICCLNIAVILTGLLSSRSHM